MADYQLGSIDVDFVDKSASPFTRTASGLGTPANYDSLGLLKAALTAQDSNAYSAAMLHHMTINDMVYASRLKIDTSTL